MRKIKLDVPLHFTLGAHKINVTVLPESDHEKAGVWIQEENSIRLYPKGRSYEYMMQTFFHELVHAILDVWARPEDSGNEDLVDAMSQGIMQFTKTAKYDG